MIQRCVWLILIGRSLITLSRCVIGDWRILTVRAAAEDSRIPADTSVPALFTIEQGLAFIERQQRRIIDGEGIALAIVEQAE